MTRVVMAVDSFKGTIRAADAVVALAAGWREVDAHLDAVMRPMADGGEGTLDAFLAANPAATQHVVAAPGADGAEHNAPWVMLADGTGVLDLASICGIEGIGARRLPYDAHSTGLGVVLAAVLDAGAERIVAGIGSSASTDGGAGVFAGLGARILDGNGRPVRPGARGLPDVATVDLSGMRSVPRGGVRVLCDVTTPLAGAHGAAGVFGPQKGAAPADVPVIDAALARWGRKVRSVLPSADPDAPGAGAAGGVGFALQAWGARLVPGAAAIADLIGLDAAIAHADVVVTGEGSYDRQSAAGKVPSLIATLAAAHGVSVLLVAGRIAPDADTSAFAQRVSLSELAGSTARAVASPGAWLREAGRVLARDAR